MVNGSAYQHFRYIKVDTITEERRRRWSAAGSSANVRSVMAPTLSPSGTSQTFSIKLAHFERRLSSGQCSSPIWSDSLTVVEAALDLDS